MPPPAPQLRLGLFDLYQVIGRGGMAEVWSGAHAEQGLPVAVKLITAMQARRPEYRAAFRTEVRAMAALDHPGILTVYDYGEVDAAALRSTKRKLELGSPYIVMELASGGSIAPFAERGRPPPTWRELRTLLLEVLDALAHAHARGLVHRDLKPANVLVCSGEDARPGLKLTDFGIVHVAGEHDRTATHGGFAGTPHYMAPEQLKEQWRDYGPWTDLYSLGCLAFELASGLRPVDADAPVVVALAHLDGRLRHFVPRLPVPAGFSGWLKRLLANDRRARFPRAADAAHALLDLGSPADEERTATASALPSPQLATSPDPAVDDAPTLVFSETERALITLASLSDDDARLPAPQAGMREVPEDWRRRGAEVSSTRLLGAGLGLFGLREIPLVDRDAERTALWDALRRAATTGRPTFLLLVGSVGCGKSRLGEWLCERAHETGAAEVLTAVHTPAGGPKDGLVPMLTRHLRCQGLERDRVLERLEAECRRWGWTDEEEWEALAELVAPAPDEPKRPSLVRLSSPGERYAAARRMLERMGEQRAVVLWLDDAQWGADSLAFCEQLLRAGFHAPCPVAVVATARREALDERPLEGAILQRLMTLPAVEQLEVGPLPPSYRPALVRELLGLEGDLAAQVEARTAGNPLFAVQLVGDWVARGLLVPGERGFSLRPGAQVDLPDDLHQVWTQHLDRLLERRAAGDAYCLELAAVLGRDVDGDEWQAVCEAAGWPAAFDLVDDLLARRLARTGEGGPQVGWSFVHGMLRESLLRRAGDRRRIEDHHRACASVLATRAGPRVGERHAHHLLSSGQREPALAALLLSAEEYRVQGDYDVAVALLDQREETLEELGVPCGDARWGEGWVLRTLLHLRRGDVEQAAKWAERAGEAADEHGWQDLQRRALAYQGNVAHLRAELATAWLLLGQAVGLAREEGDEGLQATCLADMAHVLRDQGALDQADDHYRQALTLHRAQSDATGVATCLKGLSEVAKQRGDLQAAVDHLAQARSWYERTGARAYVGYCLNSLGDLYRLRGDLPKAEDHYHEALGRLERAGEGAAAIVEVNLGLVRVDRGRYEQAREVFAARLATAEAAGWRQMEGALHACLLPCLAAARDWDAWDHHLAEATRLLADTSFLDVDIARMATRAGELAARLEERQRARTAYGIALSQWTGLEREEDARRVREALEGLRG